MWSERLFNGYIILVINIYTIKDKLLLFVLKEIKRLHFFAWWKCAVLSRNGVTSVRADQSGSFAAFGGWWCLSAQDDETNFVHRAAFRLLIYITQFIVYTWIHHTAPHFIASHWCYEALQALGDADRVCVFLFACVYGAGGGFLLFRGCI